MVDVIWPPFETPRLSHPYRAYAERALALGPFQRIRHRALGPIGACRATVAGAIAAYGGSPVAGWQVHIWPHLFFEAVAHFVWRKPDGELIDLSAKYPTDTASHSLFIPDHDTAFYDRRHNRYYIFDHAPEVHVLIEAARRQGETRHLIEMRIRQRLGLDFLEAGPWLDHINEEERAVLHDDELWVGTAIIACQRYAARKPRHRRRAINTC